MDPIRPHLQVPIPEQYITNSEQSKGNNGQSTLPTNLSEIDSPTPERSYARLVLDSLFRAPETTQPPATTLRPSVTDAGTVKVETADGYSLNFTGNREEWTITSPDNRITRIWGDPHVVESDGDTWDFVNRTSFLFGENKVTVETVPLGNGTSYSGTVSIYNGEDRFTITDIDKNDPSVVAWRLDAHTHDESLSDGTSYRLDGESWTPIS